MIDPEQLAKDREVNLRKICPVYAEGIVWIAVHGNLALALRHPGNTGPSAKLIRELLGQLEDQFVVWGIFTTDEMKEVRRDQAEALSQAEALRNER